MVMPEERISNSDVVWEVVGGLDRGGILVRKDCELESEKEADRLFTGAHLVEQSLVGERLHFRKLTGTGPEQGWVSINLPSGKDLVVRRGKGPRALRPVRQPPPGLRTVLVLGSSVAAGSEAPVGRAWASLLAVELRQYGFRLINHAMGGTTVSAWRGVLEDDDYLAPALATAGVVILSLSLANEGLPGAWGPSEIEEIAQQYTDGLRAVARNIRERWSARLVLGGPYPNNEYDESHLEVLQRVLVAMQTWEEADHVIDFLAGDVHGGAGRWGPGMASDPGHPNGRGHEAMFRCVDVKAVLGL